MRWQITGGGNGATIAGPAQGVGTTANATVIIQAMAQSGERSFRCDFISQVTGAVIATATAKITVQTPQLTSHDPNVILIQDPARTIEACMVYTGDLRVTALTVNGLEELRCPNGELVATTVTWKLKSLTYSWSGAAAGNGNGATAHVVITDPKNATARCRVVATFVNPKGQLKRISRTAAWSIHVNAYRLVQRPKIEWSVQPKLDPNPACPSELVSVVAEARSTAGKKMCGTHEAPIAISDAVISFTLPDNLDPANPELVVENGGIRVGSTASGDYTITVTATAHLGDTVDIALNGGDIAPLTQKVTLHVPPPEAKATMSDGQGESGETIALDWTITNSGHCADTFSFTFTPAPTPEGPPVIAIAALRSLIPLDANSPSAKAVALPAPIPTFALKIMGYQIENNQPTLGASGAVSIAPGDTVKGKVFVRIIGGAEGSQGTVTLRVMSRNEEVTTTEGTVKVGDYEITVEATDVFLSKDNTEEISRVTVTIKGPSGPKDPKTLNGTLRIVKIDPENIVTTSIAPNTNPFPCKVNGKEGVISIKVAAVDLKKIPEAGVKVDITVTFFAGGNEITAPGSFLVQKADKQNKLTLTLDETPFVYVGEVGVLNVQATAADKQHQSRDITVSAKNAVVATKVGGPYVPSVTLSLKDQSLNNAKWKVYYQYAGPAGVRTPTGVTFPDIEFTATWNGATEKDRVTESISQKVRIFEVQIKESAVIATEGKSPTASLTEPRAGADVRWTLTLSNGKPAMLKNEEMATIDDKSGVIKLLLADGKSAAAYTVTARLFKSTPPDAPSATGVFSTAILKAIWGTFTGDIYGGVIPEEKVIIVEAKSGKEFLLQLTGAGRVKVTIEPKDLILVDVDNPKVPFNGILEAHVNKRLVVKHDGTSGKEGAPYGKIKVMLDEGEKSEVLSIDTYVFDPIKLPVEVVAVSAKDCPFGSLEVGWDTAIISDMNRSWVSQGIIYVNNVRTTSFASGLPVASTGWTVKNDDALVDEYGRSAGIFCPIFVEGKYDKDREELGRGRTGGINLSKEWAVNIAAHELGHALSIEEHSVIPKSLMLKKINDEDHRLFITEIIKARRIALQGSTRSITIQSPATGSRFDQGKSIDFTCICERFEDNLPKTIYLTFSGNVGRPGVSIKRNGNTNTYTGSADTVKVSPGEYSIVASSGFTVSRPIGITIVGFKVTLEKPVGTSTYNEGATVACLAQVTGGDQAPDVSFAVWQNGKSIPGSTSAGNQLREDPSKYSGVVHLRDAKSGTATIKIFVNKVEGASVDIQVTVP